MTLMQSCLEASKLLSRALDEPPGLLDQAMLRVHLSMCRRCAEVERQPGSLGDLTRCAFEGEESDEPGATSPAPAGRLPDGASGEVHVMTRRAMLDRSFAPAAISVT